MSSNSNTAVVGQNPIGAFLSVTYNTSDMMRVAIVNYTVLFVSWQNDQTMWPACVVRMVCPAKRREIKKTCPSFYC